MNQYRGNLGNGEFDHQYNWFEPAGLTPAPRDNIYHGTHTMGTLVGGDGPGPFVNDIGVAPGAKWIAVKGCKNFFCSDASLIAGAEWIVCPTRTDGTEPDCDRAPDVVSNSWSSGTGTPWYQSYVRAWREAGIIPVFGQGKRAQLRRVPERHLRLRPRGRRGGGRQRALSHRGAPRCDCCTRRDAHAAPVRAGAG